MTFNFSDFEDETVGDIPTGWTLTNSNNNNSPFPFTRVVDSNVIEGDKSFRIGDAATGGFEEASHSIGDEDIRFVGTFLRGDELFGNSATVFLFVPNKWWFAFWTPSDSQAGDSFEVYYGTGNPPGNDTTQSEIQNASNDSLGNLSSGFHRLEIVDTTSSLTLRIDDSDFYDSGDSFSGASEFRIRGDDAYTITDSPESAISEFSDYIFISGNRIGVSAGNQNFVFEGKDGETRRISDNATSSYVYINGEPVFSESN